MLSHVFQFDVPSHRQILNTIRVHKEISGADLARLNNLRPSTLVYILRALSERGLIEVSRIAARSGIAGKPPTLWQLKADKGYIVGLEIIPNELRATVINFQCAVVHQEHRLGLDSIGPKKLTASIHDFFVELLRHLGLKRDQVIGIGAALTGLVDREAGIVRFSRKLELHNFPIQRQLTTKLRVPVEVVNDANAGALGIKWQAEDVLSSRPNVVFLTLNEKTAYFGAGLILNQTLYEGVNGTAGEICEALPSLHEFIARAQTRLGPHHPLTVLRAAKTEIDIEDVIRCAQEGCALSNDVLEQYADMIVEEILRIVQLLAPNVIILGGDITNARDLICPRIAEQVNRRLKQIFQSAIVAPEIEFSRHGIYSVSFGATALIQRRIFMG